MIHFMMILVNFGVFSLMLTDTRTEPRTDGRTNGRTDGPSYRDARTHLKIILFKCNYNSSHRYFRLKQKIFILFMKFFRIVKSFFLLLFSACDEAWVEQIWLNTDVFWRFALNCPKSGIIACSWCFFSPRYCFSHKFTLYDQQTDGRTHRLVEMRERT